MIGEYFFVGSTHAADARFLRRIMMVLIVLTVGTGAMAALTTVNTSYAQNAGVCLAGAICAN